MSRRGPGWVPNQHGAWAMVIAPFMVGAIAGGFAWVHVPLLAFWLIGYFAFFATSQWLRSGRRSKWFPPVRFYSLVAVGLGLVVLALEPRLGGWAPVFVPPAVVGLWAAAHRRDRDLLVGLTTVVGSSLMTVVAFDAGTDSSGIADGADIRAWWLAAVQAAYFAGTVFYVKSVIRERGSRRFWALSLGYHAACLLAAVLVASFLNPRWWWLAAVAALLLGRAVWVWLEIERGRGITPKAIGIGEAVATAVVTLLSLWVV